MHHSISQMPKQTFVLHYLCILIIIEPASNERQIDRHRHKTHIKTSKIFIDLVFHKGGRTNPPKVNNLLLFFFSKWYAHTMWYLFYHQPFFMSLFIFYLNGNI